MEHLVLRSDPLDSVLEIPFVAIDYNGGSFLTYPARRRLPWPLSYDQDGHFAHDLYLSLPSMSTSDQESFYQAWLFFGLLQVFMKEHYNVEDYKSSVGGRIRITTVNLPANMQEMWVKQVQQSSKDKSVQFRTVVTCLNLISQLSIASVCEVFSAVVAIAYWSLGVKRLVMNMATDLGLHLFEEDRKSRILSAGWCSNDIAIVAERFSSVQMLYFLSRMEKLDPQRDHHDCRDGICKWNQIKKDEYQTLHVRQTCQCSNITLVLRELELCLSKRRLPLLRLKNTDGDLQELQIEVVEYSGTEKLNPTARNGANEDAEGKLQMISDHLQVLVESGTDAEIYLWIDTLCCPVNPAESKALVIKLLEYTYQKASYVLVLDGGLVVCNYADIPVYEALARIFTSAWLQRDPNLGDLTELGLLVKWPGFKLIAKEFHDLPVRNPWTALPRLRESRILFKSEDGTRYQFSSKEHTTGNSAYRHAEGTFPLHDIIQRGDCHWILADDGLFKREGFNKGLGILGNVTGSSIDGRILNFVAAEQVLVFTTSEKECTILDTAERVAYQLRAEPLTAKLAAIDADSGSEAYDAVLDLFKKRLDEVCAKVAKSELLTEAIIKVYNREAADQLLRVLVRDWFYHDIVGKSLSIEQQWFVD
ncbi:hypothetical protein MMC18_003350 [Xylographa bjoerkii]|nr:hypothetical protein [Xylographa bjoerkii]